MKIRLGAARKDGHVPVPSGGERSGKGLGRMSPFVIWHSILVDVRLARIETIVAQAVDQAEACLVGAFRQCPLDWVGL